VAPGTLDPLSTPAPLNVALRSRGVGAFRPDGRNLRPVPILARCLARLRVAWGHNEESHGFV
jgi:hypothetical protein